MIKEVTGNIDHRLLINYRIDPEIAQQALPPHLEPKLVNGYAIGGICQVSLSKMRPKGAPAILGTSSHNAAHRISVVSAEGEGVFVPRRDTNSLTNVLAGGRVFAGLYHQAFFDVKKSAHRYKVEICSAKNKHSVSKLMLIDAELSNSSNPTNSPSFLNESSAFASLDEISEFFQNGKMGWSIRRQDNALDAIELFTKNWNMQLLKVNEVYSSYFSDESIFPRGSVAFDCATVMTNIDHSWLSKGVSFS